MPQIFPYWEQWHVYLSRVHKTYTAVKYSLCNKGENLQIISNSHTQRLPKSININSWSKYFDNHRKTGATLKAFYMCMCHSSGLNFANAEAKKM